MPCPFLIRGAVTGWLARWIVTDGSGGAGRPFRPGSDVRATRLPRCARNDIWVVPAMPVWGLPRCAGNDIWLGLAMTGLGIATLRSQ